MFDWNSDKFINLFYPSGAGGNFVGCCLAFSPSVSPHDRKLMGLGVKEQQTELYNRAKQRVYDFGCGMIEQYGILFEDYQADLCKRLIYPLQTVEANSNGKYLINVIHTPLALEKIKLLFSNSQTVGFQNFNKILSKRNYKLPETSYTQKFSTAAGEDWQDLTYDNLEQWQQSEINDSFPNFEYYSKNRDLLTDENHIICECYLDADKLLEKDLAMEEIKKLYDFFNLEEYNESLLSKFHECWQI